MAIIMAGPAGGKTLRASNMARLILLGMMPLYANAESHGVVGREKADSRGSLRNGSGRILQNGGECGVDFAGVRSSDGTGKICCVEECGVCGGVGCSKFASHLGFTKEHCCTSAIQDSGVLCSDTEEAPCIIELEDDDETEQYVMDFEFVRCSEFEAEDEAEAAFFFTGVGGNLDLDNCYDECAKKAAALYFAVFGEDNVCGCGSSSDFLDAYDKPLGNCNITCPGDIAQTCGGGTSYNLYEIFERNSDDEVDTSDLPKCSSGITGVESESGDVCCPYTCGTCGGSRCRGEGGCCEHTIQEEEELCSDTNVAPCIYNKVDVATLQPAPLPSAMPFQESFCTNGFPGVESTDGTTCCEEECNVCNGLGEDCAGVTNCCGQAIQDAGVNCSDVDVEESPCIL